MKHEDRKAAIAAYKERKVATGIYAVSCAETGEQWVGSAPDLATIWNRLTFTLREGVNRHTSLQEAWRAHGAESFSFRIVEEVDAETLEYGRERVLKGRLDHWCEALGAAPI